MAKTISLQKTWFRFLVFSFVGVTFKFFFDIVFSLIYRNYELVQGFETYFWGIILALTIQEGIYWINKRLSQKLRWEKDLIRRFIIQLFINSVYAIFLINIVRILVSFLFFEKDFIRFSDEAIFMSVTFFAMTLISTGDLGWFLFNKWKISIVEIEKYKKEKAEFHLGMLQAQINPHFLFNSLNTLSSLIHEDKALAAEYTRELADVYRYVLDSRKNELVELKEEKSFTESFLKLYKLRFNKMLIVDFKIENIDGFFLPPLIMQLLIENAVKHNIVSKSKPLTLDIFQSDDSITIKNNLQEKKSISYSSEVGLDNIVSRYKYITERKVEIIKTEHEFIVKIPLIKQDESIDNRR